jgi:hypothetical protein
MSVITISKKIAGSDDLVILPRREYDALRQVKRFKEFRPTSVQRRALVRAESNLKRGKTLSYNEFVRKMGFTDRP